MSSPLVAAAAGLTKPVFKAQKPATRTYEELKELFAKQDATKATKQSAKKQRMLAAAEAKKERDLEKVLKEQERDSRKRRKLISKGYKYFMVGTFVWDNRIASKREALRAQGIKVPEGVVICVFGAHDGTECQQHAVHLSRYPLCRKHLANSPFDSCCSVSLSPKNGSLTPFLGARLQLGNRFAPFGGWRRRVLRATFAHVGCRALATIPRCHRSGHEQILCSSGLCLCCPRS
jgi:hypothetical protein